MPESSFLEILGSCPKPVDDYFMLIFFSLQNPRRTPKKLVYVAETKAFALKLVVYFRILFVRKPSARIKFFRKFGSAVPLGALAST